jgi:type IV pilus assembly protein PilB
MEGLDDDLENLDISGGDESDKKDKDIVGSAEDEAPIVKYINKVLLDAIKMGASDLHFEPYEKAYRIRFRVDGVLREYARPPIQLSGKMSARLKVMSQMDISERRVPQDGRIKLKLSKTKLSTFVLTLCPHFLAKNSVCVFLTLQVLCWVLICWVMNPTKKNYLWMPSKNHRVCY